MEGRHEGLPEDGIHNPLRVSGTWHQKEKPVRSVSGEMGGKKVSAIVLPKNFNSDNVSPPTIIFEDGVPKTTAGRRELEETIRAAVRHSQDMRPAKKDESRERSARLDS